MSLDIKAPRATRLEQVAWRLGGLVAALTISACGGGGGGTPAPSGPDFEVFSGARACGAGGCGGDSADGSGVGSGGDGGDGAGGGLGEMQFVKVTVTKPDGTVLGSAALDSNLVSLYPRAYTGPIVLEFADDGSGNGAYYDESTKTWLKIGAAKFHVLVPALTHHVSVNPLTEAAYQWALNKYGSVAALDAAKMTTANNAVRDAFNLRVPSQYRVTDITNYSVAVSDATAAGALPNTHAGRWSTLLASLPRAALHFNPGLRFPALAFMNQITNDLLDDDTVNASVVTAGDVVAYGADLPQAITEAVSSVISEWGSSEQPAPTSAPSTCFNIALFTVGTKWDLTYNEFPFDSSATTSSFTAEVTRTTTFEGTPGLLEVKITDTSPDANGGVSYAYYGTDFSNGVVNYGSLIPDPSTGGSFVVTYTPPYADRLSVLTLSETQAIDVTSTFFQRDSLGNIIGKPSTVTNPLTTTFVGYEDISTEGANYRQACRFESPNGNGGVDVTWFTSSGQGVPVKTQSTDANGRVTDSSELATGTVNGVPVK